MKIITQNKDVKKLLRQNYEQIYENLKEILPAKYFIFSNPSSYSAQDYTEWTFDVENEKITKILSFDEITSQESMAFVANQLDAVASKIKNTLANNKGLNAISHNFLVTPSKKNIHYVETENNKQYVFLTAWACSDSKDELSISPVGEIVEKYANLKTEVIIQLKYTDGSLITDRTFYYFYEDAEHKVKTNFEGQKKLGQWLIGANFEVYDKENDEKVFLNNFTVVENQKIYEIVFILYVNAAIKVKNQKNEILADRKVLINYQNKEKEYTTDEFGNIELSKLEVDELVSIKDSEFQEITDEYKTINGENQFEFIIYQPVNAKVKVVNQFDEFMPNFKIDIEYLGDTKTYTTDENGEVYLKELYPKKQISVSETEKKQNKKAFQINLLEEENEFVFEIEVAVPHQLKITIIDHKKKIVVNQEVLFKHREKEYRATTDENGICFLEIEEINEGEFLEVFMTVEKSRKLRKIKFLKQK